MTQTKLTLHLIFEKWLQKFGHLFASRSLSPFLSLFPFVLNEWKIPLFNFELQHAMDAQVYHHIPCGAANTILP